MLELQETETQGHGRKEEVMEKKILSTGNTFAGFFVILTPGKGARRPATEPH